MKFNQTMAQRIRKILLSVAQNESVFLCAIFFSYSFLSTNVLTWYGGGDSMRLIAMSFCRGAARFACFAFIERMKEIYRRIRIFVF